MSTWQYESHNLKQKRCSSIVCKNPTCFAFASQVLLHYVQKSGAHSTPEWSIHCFVMPILPLKLHKNGLNTTKLVGLKFQWAVPGGTKKWSAEEGDWSQSSFRGGDISGSLWILDQLVIMAERFPINRRVQSDNHRTKWGFVGYPRYQKVIRLWRC